MVIFGAAGDLTRRLLIPALYNLAAGKLLPEGFRLVGVARADLSDEAFRDDLTQGIRQFATAGLDEKVWDELVGRMSYVRGNFDDPDCYRRLKTHLAENTPGGADEKFGNILFYLATAAGLRLTRLVLSGGTSKVASFKHSLETALNTKVELADPFRKITYSPKDFDPGYLKDLAPLVQASPSNEHFTIVTS